MKRIAFLIMDMEHGGGTERVTSLVANGLSRQGYAVSIISCRNGISSVFDLSPEIRLLSLHGETTENAILRKFETFRKLRHTVKSERIDILVAVEVSLYLYAAFVQMFGGGVKCIAWEHFNCHYEGNFMRSVSRHLAARFADCVVVLGDRDLNNYKKRYKHIRRIERLYNPLAMDCHNTSDMGQKAVIAVGRLEEQKGFDRLITVWSKLEDRFPEWSCDVYGDGSQKALLERMISDEGLQRIFLRGYRKNIEAEYLRHSIFVFSSRFEGFGLVLIEAQAKGLPCVSFDCPEGPAEIVDNGINGFLVPNDDIEAFTEKLGELMESETLREAFSRQSRKDLARFHPDTVIAQWRALIESL